MIGVERTDFVGIPVTDRARAVKFYGETLGLKRNPISSDEWPEFETGNVFFKDPDGNSFVLHHRHKPYSDGSLP